MNHPNAPDVARLDLGEVTVFFGDKNGKYPDGNQVVVREWTGGASSQRWPWGGFV